MNKTAQHILVAVLGAGLVLMVGITLMERLQNPSLVQHVAPQHRQAAQPMEEESPMAKLMREAGDHPDNPQAQLQLAIMLLQEGKLDEAEVFLDKAQVLDVNNADVPYLKGYIANVRKDYPKAAALMEESLKLQDRVEVRTSAGTLYRYYLNDIPKALAHWQKALENPQITPAQKAQIEAEITKVQRDSAAPSAR